MWNWKYMYEDDDLVCYCDIEHIVDLQEDESGYYHSIECYQSLSSKIAVWTTFFIKNKEEIGLYCKERERTGMPTKGYRNFNHVLCLIEIDLEKQSYRATAALDYDKKGNELGASTVVNDRGKSFLKNISGDWSPIQSKKTHKSISAILKFLQ